MHQIIPGLMLTQSIVLGVLAYILYRKQKAKLALCHKAWGEVIEVKEHHGGEGPPTKHPIVRYTALNGETVTFESKFGSSNWKFKQGDRIEIFINRSDSKDAEVVGFMAQWGLPFIFGMVLVASIIGTPIIYLIFKP